MWIPGKPIWIPGKSMWIDPRYFIGHGLRHVAVEPFRTA
jgi:hypothetical protein